MLTNREIAERVSNTTITMFQHEAWQWWDGVPKRTDIEDVIESLLNAAEQEGIDAGIGTGRFLVEVQQEPGLQPRRVVYLEVWNDDPFEDERT